MMQQDDQHWYSVYEELVNPAYPAFLRRLGLESLAVKAEGCLITDSTGKSFIDCVGGYGVFNCGHNHPQLMEAVCAHLRKSGLQTRPLISREQAELAQALAEIAPGDLQCSFMCNSGSEAIDSALKLARLYRGKKKIISARGAFHGCTFGALSVSAVPSIRRPFEPLLPSISHVSFGDVGALRQELTSEEAAAVLLEPVQHEAGVHVAPEGYLQAVRDLCDQAKALFILDEIKTGFGKTGAMFACEHAGVTPDILVLGKSLGGGIVPCGALIAKQELWTRFGLSFAMSATSYGGNTLACCAALAVIRILKEGPLLTECREKGERLLSGARDLCAKFPQVLQEAKGVGLLVGVRATSPQRAASLSRAMISSGVLALQAFVDSRTLMLEPPLVISFEQIERVLAVMHDGCLSIASELEEKT